MICGKDFIQLENDGNGLFYTIISQKNPRVKDAEGGVSRSEA
ncbi:hypothetical protein [Treponema sp.]|nr:hypothetical protein [Treponema sp.]